MLLLLGLHVNDHKRQAILAECFSKPPAGTAGTYGLLHIEDSSTYLVNGYADPDGSGHWPQGLRSSKLGNLWRDKHSGYEMERGKWRKQVEGVTR